MVRCRGRLIRNERVEELAADSVTSPLTMSRTAWGDYASYGDGYDGSSHSLLQSIYGSQTSQILLSGRLSEAQLVIEEVDEEGWSDDENVTVSMRPGSSQGPPSAAAATRSSQPKTRPKTALPYSSHHHYRPTHPTSSTSLVSTSRGGAMRPHSAMRSRPSSGRPQQAHATGHEQTPMRRRPMSAAVPRSYSMQSPSRSSFADVATGRSQLSNRPRPKSAFVGSARSVPLLDYDSSEEDQLAPRPQLQNTNPVFRTHVPEYINFWGGKPLQNRDFGVVVHERKPWKRPSSDYGTRGASSRRSSAASSGTGKKVSDEDLLAGIGGDSGSGAGGQVGGWQLDEDKRGESARGIGLQDGGGLMLGGLLQGRDGSSNDKDKDKDGFSGIGGSLLDGLVNGDDSSGKVTKRDTSENDRNRKAYRSGTHSENRYGKGQHEEEGSAGSEEEDFFKKTVDDKLPSIPSTNSLTGGASRDGLGCTDDLGNETADSMSDGDDTLSGHALTLPQLVANTSDLLVPPKTGSPKRQKPVCQPQRNSLEFDIISFSELQLDKPPKDAKWLSARLALTRHSTRFELPLDLRDLQGLSPADYLQKYTVISERRAAHYTKVYRKFLKPPAKSITHKDLVPALCEVHFGTVDQQQVEEVLQVVQLSEDVNDVDLRLFAGLCALAERMLRAFTLPTRSTSALTEYGQHREIVEDADFEALEWKLRGVTITDSLQALFTKL